MDKLKEIRELFNNIKDGNFSLLNQKIYSEDDLRDLSKNINRYKHNSKLVYNLVDNIPNRNRIYDWNIGSILQHLKADYIIDALRRIDLIKFYNSIGLVWALGEFKNTSRVIVDFLFLVVKHSSDADAWWRAAFSLEKLGIEEAVNMLKMSLKNKKLMKLEYYLNNLNNKRSIIGILILSNVDNIERVIYPRVKKVFLESSDCKIIINCCWLIGRLKLIDKKIYKKLLQLMGHNNYELRYYTFFALQNNATEKLRPIMEQAIFDGDPLIRKMAARSLISIGNEKSLYILEDALYKENEVSVVSEISKAIYSLKNPLDRNNLLIEMKSYRNENGMISDDSDKWYSEPAVYHIFSEAEDPENVCFNLVSKRIDHKKIINPIDLATGTGRMLWQIMEKINFQGKLFGVDASSNMIDYVNKTVKRERKYTNNVKLINSTIKDLPKKISLKSNFIISSFGFPSKISNRKQCLDELRAVCSLLSDDGVFITIGWDETFNDELNMMWFKYIPDSIFAQDFEGWRKKRAESINSCRNCNLTWFKKGVNVPLQFSSLKESAHVMGYLFGRDAAQYVIKTGKIEWMMSMGITLNTKSELKQIIKKYEGS